MKHSPIAEYAGWLIPSVVAVCSVGVCLAQDSSSVAEVCHQGLEYFKIKEYEKAAECFRKAAEQGHARAQFELGACYSLGKGVSEDSAEALKWFRKAADQGHEYSCFMLGVYYECGKGGVEKDIAEAKKWYRRAAAHGNLKAYKKLEALSD